MSATSGPIGVFDSGVGGLAVLLELRRLLPAEDFVYFADQANFPYGPRSADDVRRLALDAAARLIGEGAKLLVVACNTASSAALPVLRARFDVPIVGIEPALKPASALTHSGRVGVLATSGTVQGTALASLTSRFADGHGVVVYRTPAPALVELVERGAPRADVEAVVRSSLAPLVEADVDVVVLGCTHFAFVRAAIERALGPGVQVLEPAAAVARQAARVVAERGLATAEERPGTIRYVSSANSERLQQAVEELEAMYMRGTSVEQEVGCEG